MNVDQLEGRELDRAVAEASGRGPKEKPEWWFVSEGVAEHYGTSSTDYRLEKIRNHVFMGPRFSSDPAAAMGLLEEFEDYEIIKTRGRRYVRVDKGSEGFTDWSEGDTFPVAASRVYVKAKLAAKGGKE